MFHPVDPINLTMQCGGGGWHCATAARREILQAPAWDAISEPIIEPLISDSSTCTPSTTRANEPGECCSCHTNTAIAEHARSGAHIPFPHGVTSPHLIIPPPHLPAQPPKMVVAETTRRLMRQLNSRWIYGKIVRTCLSQGGTRVVRKGGSANKAAHERPS